MFSAKIRKNSIGKMKSMQLLAIFLVPLATLILGTTASQVWAGGVQPFDDGKIYFELNNTDGDLGIHGLIDGGPWKHIWIKDSKNRLLMTVKAWGRLKNQAVTELFFESAEPTFDELSPEEFFQRFPEGKYKIFGWSEDGELLKSVAEVSHVMPAPPGYTSGDAVLENAENDLELVIEINGESDEVSKEKCDDEDLAFDPTEVELDDDGNIVITWPPVEDSHPNIGEPGNIEVELYQGVVEFETEDEFEAKYTVDIPPGVTSFTIPGSFIALGLDEEGEGEFKYEILVKEEEGGNQTATESCFIVVPGE